MTWIKICGMTNLEDALVAADAGADAVGFVFYEKSPRCVTVQTAREIVEKLPESVEKVGVFVSESPVQADEVLRQAKLTAVQVYSEGLLEDWLAWYEVTEHKLMVAVSGDALKDDFFMFLGTRAKPISAIVIDSGSGASPGGTGEKFDWEGAKVGVWHVGSMVPVVIAGGLTPENVRTAIRTFSPWGVDVSSGVEARPGKKDPEKVRAFVRAVREADKRVS